MEEGYYEVDLAGNFTFFNDAMCRIRGYTRDELMGMNNREYMDSETAKKVYKTYNEVYRTGRSMKNCQWETMRKDGTEEYVEVSVALIKDLDGKPIGFRGIVRDINERKQAQKIEAIGTLAGGIAHDFNNLLMSIQGRASIMLMKKDSSDPDFGHLRGIEDNVESAADLTRQLLGFARAGKYEVKPTDLNELIKKQNRMFGRTKKEITIRGKYEKDLWSVEVDRGQIESR